MPPPAQVFVTSRDGTQVPMFVTHRKGLKLDGTAPTLMYGYGGFNVPMEPGFSPSRCAHPAGAVRLLEAPMTVRKIGRSLARHYAPPIKPTTHRIRYPLRTASATHYADRHAGSWQRGSVASILPLSQAACSLPMDQVLCLIDAPAGLPSCAATMESLRRWGAVRWHAGAGGAEAGNRWQLGTPVWVAILRCGCGPSDRHTGLASKGRSSSLSCCQMVPQYNTATRALQLTS